MVDLVSLGEVLIDFTPAGSSARGNPLFERNPGGGPANMACAVARLGGRVAFIGQVGNDVFGRSLKNILEGNGVDAARLRLSDAYQTTLAFVHLAEDGERSFSFYRRQGADTMLEPEPEDYATIEGARAFFFSSVLMTEGTSRRASFTLAAYAREKGVLTVFDPNLRLNLWESAEEARRVIREALSLADIVKVSEEELRFLTGAEELEEAARLLRTAYPMRALLVTLGREGCRAYIGARRFEAAGYPVDTVDTTGAGDSFTGGFLFCLLQGTRDITARTDVEIVDMLQFANAVGALTTTKKGGIPALPSYDVVLEFLR